MNLEMENFLEAAFTSIKPTSDAIGRVVVEPDYESGTPADDAQQLRNSLIELLNSQQDVDSNALQSQDGFEVKIPDHYQHLSQCIRRITLHADKIEGDWIEVAPPGNWI